MTYFQLCRRYEHLCLFNYLYCESKNMLCLIPNIMYDTYHTVSDIDGPGTHLCANLHDSENELKNDSHKCHSYLKWAESARRPCTQCERKPTLPSKSQSCLQVSLTAKRTLCEAAIVSKTIFDPELLKKRGSRQVSYPFVFLVLPGHLRRLSWRLACKFPWRNLPSWRRT